MSNSNNYFEKTFLHLDWVPQQLYERYPTVDSALDALESDLSPDATLAVFWILLKNDYTGLSNSMAVHYGRDNIRVNCIVPGHVHSPMVARAISEEMRELRRKAGPLGIEGNAWDVAWSAVFLASDEARWISGVTLPVDAGLLAASPLAMLPYLGEPELAPSLSTRTEANK